jgi:NTE family protein
MKDYHFRNLVFEGGGVKGIAYTSALEILEDKGILQNVERIAGTSAGAIVAAFLALGFTPKEMMEILKKTDFRKFKDESFRVVGLVNMLRKFGWFKGNEFQRWFENEISKKVPKGMTFRQLKEIQGIRDLYIIGTNLNKGKSEIYSFEHAPDMKVSDAVRISMSIPLFFRAVKRNKEVLVDGGVYYNFPLNLFDNEKYLSDKKNCSPAPYLKREGAIYNKETLGLRVDSVEEIEANLGKIDSVDRDIKSIKSYSLALIEGLVEMANRVHLHKNDWHRTIYIESGNVKATDFSLGDKEKDLLLANGRNGVEGYFEWFDKPKKGEEKPLNK